MDDNRFGALLQRYRQQAIDPMTKGGQLSQGRLADLVREETRIAISAQQIEAWETGRERFPAQGSWNLLLGIVEILQRSGGLQTLDETNELVAAAGYDPIRLTESSATSEVTQPYTGLTNQGMLNAFFQAAGPGDYWDWITRAGLESLAVPAENRTKPYDGPVIEALSGLRDEERRALEDALGQFADPSSSPPPVIPKDAAEIARRGTTIRVANVEKAWLLPVDALVLVAAGTLDRMGGEFYGNLIEDLNARGEKTGYELEAFLQREFPSDLRNDNPAYRKLPDDLGLRVLPYAREGQAGVFIVTRKASQDDPLSNFEEGLTTMLPALVNLAADHQVQSLAISLIGSGGGKMMMRSSQPAGRRSTCSLTTALKMCSMMNPPGAICSALKRKFTPWPKPWCCGTPARRWRWASWAVGARGNPSSCT